MQEISPRIMIDPQIRFGKPFIQGTRVPVHLVLDHLAVGTTQDELCREFDLTSEDILAALAYAAKVLRQEELRAV